MNAVEYQSFSQGKIVNTSVSDSDSIRINQVSGSGSESRRAKMTQKNRKKVKKIHVLKSWMFSFEC
jgi:hypothetical protein